jgi:hypothetical protein
LTAEREYDMQFWKEELVREIEKMEEAARELQVRYATVDQTIFLIVRHSRAMNTLYIEPVSISLRAFK